jgi:aminopeptidase N
MADSRKAVLNRLIREQMTRIYHHFRRFRSPSCGVLLALVTALGAPFGRADAPYAPSRDYDLEDLRTHLWFDVAERAVRGEVAESVVMLRDGVSDLKFDSVGLEIKEVSVDGRETKFTVEPSQLLVSLTRPSGRGERHEITIRYDGQPRKGLYFILPDKNYPDQSQEIWTQGEAEDTRYYIPLYDYPNDRTASEMLLTVPAKWITVSNGQLLSVKDEADGTKTWDWKQSEPLSTYLLTAVAGDFVERKDSWRGVPLRFVVPRGEESKIEPTFARTKEMLDLFSNSLGVPYPWAQYAQTAVDDFVVGGMENTSATTLSTRDLVHPALAPELRVGDDTVISHELAHQWFGDLVTCKDWANLWLNEGFATYFEHYWLEQHYGRDESDYEFWRDQSKWFAQKRLFSVPILTRDFDDSTKYDGNVYGKASWVLRMLRQQLGDENFFRALHRYLVTNRGQNVVTADLQKAIEETSGISVDKFFDQWIYGAGAPQFHVAYTYDEMRHQVTLDVTQTQKPEDSVGIFDVPVEIEIRTASGSHTYPIEINQASQSFHFPADGLPLMVLFDPGDKILKQVDFKRDPAVLIYQLKHAETVPDRADAAFALGALRNDAEAITALGEAAQHDPFWGVRAEALRALGKIDGADAEKQVLPGLSDPKPWVREVAVRTLGSFKQDQDVAVRLTDLAAHDSAYRVRAAALRTLGELKAPNAFDILTAVVNSESPDGILRDAALNAFGSLGDARAIPTLVTWSAPGKPINSREEAISALGEIDKKDPAITQTLLSYLHDSHFDVRLTAILALGARGDSSAVAPLEDMRKNGELTMGEGPYLDAALSLLKTHAAAQ